MGINDEDDFVVALEDIEGVADEEGLNLEEVIASRGTPSEDNEAVVKVDSVLEMKYAIKHYERYMALCKCGSQYGKKCDNAERRNFSLHFAAMDQKDRTNTVRDILFSSAAPRTVVHEALRDYDQQVRKRRNILEDGKNVTIVYIIIGQIVYQNVFCAVVQLARATINRIGLEVTEEGFVYRKERIGEMRKSAMPSQTILVIQFLKAYGKLYAIVCPSGRGSRNEDPIRYVEKDCTAVHINDMYCEDWPAMVEYMYDEKEYGKKRPSEPLALTSFMKILRQKCHQLQLQRSGTVFCDFCTQLRNQITIRKDHKLRKALITTRETQHHHAGVEMQSYLEMCQTVSGEGNADVVHLTFDFAEKVLLPRLTCQPGQLHFIIGSKVDMFAVASSNMDKLFVNGLTEGFCPNNKTAHEVLSMFSYAIYLHRKPCGQFSNIRNLVLHPDNCGGHNKNRWVLYYVVYLALNGFDKVSLRFLIPGHTKNRREGAFGLVKRTIWQRDITSPAEMMSAIEYSCRTTSVVDPEQVEWKQWKAFLEMFFKVPSSLKIQSYFIFESRREHPGKLFAKKYSTSDTWTEFDIFGTVITRDVVGDAMHEISDTKYESVVTKVSDIKVISRNTRKESLINEVCERYYKGNDAFCEKYFAGGAG